MALPHLTSSADSPKYKLNGIVYDGDGHLLIVRQTNSYQTKELVVTPS